MQALQIQLGGVMSGEAVPELPAACHHLVAAECLHDRRQLVDVERIVQKLDCCFVRWAVSVGFLRLGASMLCREWIAVLCIGQAACVQRGIL